MPRPNGDVQIHTDIWSRPTFAPFSPENLRGGVDAMGGFNENVRLGARMRQFVRVHGAGHRAQRRQRCRGARGFKPRKSVFG